MWVPPGSLAKADTQQLVGEGRDEQNTSYSNGGVLFLSGMVVAFRTFRGQAARVAGEEGFLRQWKVVECFQLERASPCALGSHCSALECWPCRMLASKARGQMCVCVCLKKPAI